LNDDYTYDCIRDNTVVKNDRVIHVKKANMIKESWQRAFLEEILRRCFPDADYLPTKVNGKFVDYTFYIDNDDFGLEIKNINPKGKSLGLGFTKREIIARFTDEKTKGLLLSCREFTDNAQDLLEKENIHYAILPYQTTPSMSLKQWIKNKRETVAFLSKYLNYRDPFKKHEKKAKSCPKPTNLSISIDSTNNINLCSNLCQMEDSYQFSSYWTNSEPSRNKFRVIFLCSFRGDEIKMTRSCAMYSSPFREEIDRYVSDRKFKTIMDLYKHMKEGDMF